MTFFPVRSSAFATFFSLILLSILVPTGSNLNAARPANSAKVTICHRTSSVTNPYRRITVNQSSVVPQSQASNANSKHGSSSGAHNDWSTAKFPNATTQNPPSVNVFDPTFTYPANDKNWGDIVPDRDVSGNPYNYGNGQTFPGMNYTGDGLAIYNGTGNFAGLCKSLSTKQFIKTELAAGKSEQQVVDEINEQQSDDDKPVLDALGGGPLTLQTLGLIATVGAITNEPTGVTSSTGTLNGEFKLATGKTATNTRFIYGTDATCAAGTTVSAAPTSATTGTPVSFNATGLTAGTTYFYKVLGTVDAGTDSEVEVEGDCARFVVAQGLPSSEPSASAPTAGGSTAGGSTAGSIAVGGPIVTNLPATGASSRLQVLATLMTLVGLALVAVRRRRLI